MYQIAGIKLSQLKPGQRGDKEKHDVLNTFFFLLQFSLIRAQELQASQPYLRPLEENEPNMLRGLLQLYER